MKIRSSGEASAKAAERAAEMVGKDDPPRPSLKGREEEDPSCPSRPSKSPLKGDFGFSPFKGEIEGVFGEIEGVS